MSAENAINLAKLKQLKTFWREKEADKHADSIKETIYLCYDGKQDPTLVEDDVVR